MAYEELLHASDYFELLVDEYGDLVTRICYLRLSNYADAEDCWQNVFLTLYRKRLIWDKPPDEIRRWLITVTINECRDNLRKLFHRTHEDIDQLIIPYNEDFDKTVLTAVKDLPIKFSEVIYLHYYEGYGTKEIAGMLKRNENTVKSQLKRGREMLKGAIEDA